MPYVYICITGPNRFKIGKTTKSVKQRIKEHATGNPNTIVELIDFQTEQASKLETFLKSKFYKEKCKTGSSTEHYCYDCTNEELRAKLRELKEIFDEHLLLKEQANEFKNSDHTSIMKKPNEKIKNICSDLYQIKGQLAGFKYQKEKLENQLKIFIEDSMGIEGCATWKMQSSQEFDEQKFKQEHEELYKKYMIESKSRSFKLIAKG